MSEQIDGALFGGVEAGGTKFVCGIGIAPKDFRTNGKLAGEPTVNRTEFKTADGPAVVLPAVVKWFKERETHLGRPLSAIGIASFGPVDLDESHPNSYGCITSTPKLDWRDTNLLRPFKDEFGEGFPIGFDTDVNGAALGEHRWGAAQDEDDFVYISIGTGLGAGAMARGRLLHGLVHPEMGHMLLPRIPGDPFPGVCTRHGACWEGLCSGKAIEARAGCRAEMLEAGHQAWTFTTRYIAYAVANLICILSPRKVIIGGSVRKAGKLGEDHFFQRIRDEVQTALAGYIVSGSLAEGIDKYIVPPELGDDAGVCGAIELARLKLSGQTG
jgi:fructokinase